MAKSSKTVSLPADETIVQEVSTVTPVANDKAPKAVSCDIAGHVLTFTFGDGITRELHALSLSDDIKTAAMLHGLKQKIVDAAAISRDPVTGKSATFSDKAVACMDIIARLESGHWNKPAGEPRDDTGGMFLRALMEVWGSTDVAATKARMAGWGKDQIAAVKKNPRVTAIMARMATEAAKARGIDSDALLGDI